MGVAIMHPADLRARLHDRTCWIVAFGNGLIDVADELDRAIGRYPTFPTALVLTASGLIALTIIPKAELSRRRLLRALRQLDGPPADLDLPHGKDIIMLSDPTDQASLAAALHALAGEAVPC